MIAFKFSKCDISDQSYENFALPDIMFSTFLGFWVILECNLKGRHSARKREKNLSIGSSQIHICIVYTHFYLISSYYKGRKFVNYILSILPSIVVEYAGCDVMSSYFILDNNIDIFFYFDTFPKYSFHP